MPATAVYALRYQALTDAPNGATLGQNLAEDVETELVRIDAAAAVLPLYARKTADESLVSSTTLQNDDHLFWSVVANTIYELSLHVTYNSGVTPDFKIGWTFPAGLTMTWAYIGVDLAGAIVNRGNLIQTSVLAQGGAAGVEIHLAVFGVVVVGGTAGTLRLQWAQNTSDAGSTIVRAGSYGRLLKVG